MDPLMEGMGNPEAQRLLESWGKNIEAVRRVDSGFSTDRAVALAQVLESTKTQLDFFEQRVKRGLMETTQAVDVSVFKRYAFDILTAVFPNLIAQDIVSVQPLKLKVGQVFYLQYQYGSTRNGVNAGDVIFSPYQVAPSITPDNLGGLNYTKQDITGEQIQAATGGGGTATFGGFLQWLPVMAGTVSIYVDTIHIVDDGHGALTSNGLSAPGTINYGTGQFSFTLGSANTHAAVAAYTYNLENGPAQAPEINLKVQEVTMTAYPRKLKALYAFDSSYDLQMTQGIDMDAALMEAASMEIKHEVDGEIMNDLLTQAYIPPTPVAWEKNPPDHIAMVDHKDTFVDMIVSTSNIMYQKTRRAMGNFAICGKRFADVAESMGSRWTPSGTGLPAGPYFAGTIDGKWKVYKNPYYPENKFLIGYKGDLFLDAGYVYAPYLPLFATSLIMMEDFVGRRGFATSYAKKMLNNLIYIQGSVTISGS